ncbi:radical SAM protein [Candidatus Microgenomates bacterium]|nr:radical SAM protein [Candidatus Microgenomates bacterium]
MEITNTAQLTPSQIKERAKLEQRWPRSYEKQQRFDANAVNGVISPILRLCWSFLCNFHCEHCCAEHYMDRHLVKVTGSKEQRRELNLDDVRDISRQADEYGIYRFVLTGGEPTTWKDLFAVIEAVDPAKHLVILDSNAWLLDEKFARRLADAGVYKMQISLDSFIEAEHDLFRSKPGSYRRVMRAIEAVQETDMKLMLSTCLIRGRASTPEFENLCRFATEQGIMLYVTYAKPVGTLKVNHEDFVITKEDADHVRELEKRYNVTTHMTPAYMRGQDGVLGHYDGCITVKGINTITSTGEIVPCPYMDMSIGNVLREPLATILDRGMRNKFLGPHRKDCLIGEDAEFIERHNQAVEGRVQLPAPYGEGFSDKDLIV